MKPTANHQADAQKFQMSVLDALSAHIAILDEQGTIIQVNAAWKRFAGENYFGGGREGVGENYLQTCDAASSPMADGIRAVMAGKCHEFQLEYACHGPNKKGWFVGRASLFCGEGPGRVVIAHENITDRKYMDEVLQASEQRLQLAVKAGGLGVFEHTLSDNQLVVSPEFCDILGLPPQPSFSLEAFGQHVHPEDRELVMHEISQMLGKAAALDLEYRVCLPQGETRWVRVMASPLVVQGTVERVFGVLQNITKQHQAEAELQQFSLAVAYSPVSVVITNLLGEIEYVNPKFSAVTGYSFEEVRGKNPRVLKSGEMACDNYQKLWAAITSGQEWHGEFHNRKKTGELYWESASISPVCDAFGKITHFIAIKEDITARKQAAQELADSRQFLDQIINAVGDPLFVRDRQHRLVVMNAAYCALLGREREELVGRTVRDFFPAAKAEELWERDDLVYNTGRENLQEETLADAAGNAQILVTRKNLFCNERGEQFLVGVIHDITESKKLEEALRESDRRQKAILDNIPDPAWLRDCEGRFLIVNRAWCQFAGLDASEAAGKTVAEIAMYPTEIARAIQADDQLVMASGKSSQSELQLTHATRGKVWFEISKTVLVDKAGNIFGLAGIARNITERKRADLAQREQIALQERVAKIAANAPGIIYSFRMRPDGSTCLPYISPTVEEFYGVKADAVLNDASRIFELIHPEDLVQIKESIAESARTMKPWRGEFRVNHPRKGCFWIEGQSTPEREADGGTLWHGFMGDITERKQAAQALAEHQEREERSRQELEREHALNETKSRFVSLVSHEFRTPLCAINMAAFLIADYGDGMSDTERAQHARDILLAVGRMTNMMEEFLVHDKIQTGKMACKPARVNLESFCRDLIQEVVNSRSNPRVINCHLDPATGEANLDEKIFRHIFGNLLHNAVKYSADDQPVMIELRRVAGNTVLPDSTKLPAVDHLQLKVSDSGIGIPEADLPKLFQTFHRASNVGNRPGTGMGLSIVKQFVDLHSGLIRVDSKEGQGTTFSVWLPCELSAKTAPAAALTAR